MLTCFEYDSCIYYNYDVSTDTCKLCIHDDDQLFASGELQSDSNELNDDVQIKTDPSAAFRNHMCSEIHNDAPSANTFNYTDNAITEIHLCLSDFEGVSVYSGFRLSSGGVTVGVAGLCDLYDTSLDEVWSLSPGEIILRVVFYVRLTGSQQLLILRDMVVYTDRDIHGPIEGGSGSIYTSSGYKLLGFVGNSNVYDLITGIGANFEGC